MKTKLIAVIFALPCVASADAFFHCYSYPGVPVQTFEYGAASCSSSSTSQKEILSGQGEREIMCVYQAGCGPIEKMGEKAPDLTRDQLAKLFADGTLKMSTLTCRGQAEFENGAPIAQTCPPPTQCQEEVFYNPLPPKGFKQGTVVPMGIQKVTTPKAVQ